MKKLVKIVHPEAGETKVPESAVRHWRRAGWKPADEVEEVTPADGTTPGGTPPPDGPPADKPAEKESKASGRPRRQPDKESE